MNNKLECDIVRDLLPSYTDGLTSSMTNTAMEEHLANCPDCAEALRLMREPDRQPHVAEVDYLKKVRRRTSRVGIICGIIMMVIGMLLILAKVFFIGSAADATDASFNVSVADNIVYVSGDLTGSATGVARITFEESSGIVNIKLYTALKSFFNSGEINAQYAIHGDSVGMVRCGDQILWADGIAISPTVSRLYAEMNPFVGDMPSNSRIATILGISDQFGSYTNELQTASEPYGWTLHLDTLIEVEEENAARDIMTADSYVMLATIENLGYVTWQYETAAGTHEYTVTTKDATAYAGRDIKEYAHSASDLQRLLEGLSLKWAGVRETLQEDGTFYLKIQNNVDADIYGLTMDYYIDGELTGSSTIINANETTLKQGEEITFDFTPNDFSKGSTAISLSKFSFDLYVLDKDANKIVISKHTPVSAQYAWSYFFSLSGDWDTGFSLNEG